MEAAHGDCEFIAHFAPEHTRLGKA
jgi:hypothetical protein